MKIKYFSLLAIASLLSLGTLAACVNPCAANQTSTTGNQVTQNDPCAGKTKTIGESLAKELQGKPVVVDIYASWCAACQNIAPTLAQLKQDYAETVNFVVLDVSNQSTTAQAEATAQELGLGTFLAENKSQTGMLTIIDPATGKILAQHRNNPQIEDYTVVLDTALAQ